MGLVCVYAKVSGPVIPGRPCMGRMISCTNPANPLPKVREKYCRPDRCTHCKPRAEGPGVAYGLRGILARRGLVRG